MCGQRGGEEGRHGSKKNLIWTTVPRLGISFGSGGGAGEDSAAALSQGFLRAYTPGLCLCRLHCSIQCSWRWEGVLACLVAPARPLTGCCGCSLAPGSRSTPSPLPAVYTHCLCFLPVPLIVPSWFGGPSQLLPFI